MNEYCREAFERARAMGDLIRDRVWQVKRLDLGLVPFPSDEWYRLARPIPGMPDR